MIKTLHCPNCEDQAVEIEELRHDLERQMTIANEHVNELADFKQEVSDALVVYFSDEHTPAIFNQFIITKPDPLAEVLEEISGEGGFDNFDHYAYNLHAALEARGFEIREKGQ